MSEVKGSVMYPLPTVQVLLLEACISYGKFERMHPKRLAQALRYIEPC